ncbi:hypothetical protein TWF696_005267 [Orbilia brochopaga]|uniref:chitinase n=1 Tax=Orbilia brochopaga TaxID=3140254 RepID=A0AAV9V166_9PEZI
MPSTHFKINCLAVGLVALLSSWGARAASNNLVVYYGQGPNQERLRTLCDNANIDTIPVGFVTQFGNTGMGGVIETNFGNQCGDPYPGTKFVYQCHYLQEDVAYCQSIGKKILLSIGGGAGVYHLETAEQAQQAADDIWSAFGPVDPLWTYGRPFGDAIVDGFDLDLEQDAASAENYRLFALALRAKFVSAPGQFYLSAAPQCIYPDANLQPVLDGVCLDYIFVQFYNNPSCRPSNILSSDDTIRQHQSDNFGNWNALAENNPCPGTTWYLGLLAQTSSDDYTSQSELTGILGAIQSQSRFGGIMLWEATFASQLKNGEGTTYLDACKHNLQGQPDEDPFATPTVPFAVSASVAPGETHLPVPSNCNLWHKVVTGDSCSAIVDQSQGLVTLEQLQEWNGGAAEACDGIWLGTWVCVGVSEATTTTTTSTTATATPFTTTFPEPPSETQVGVASNCNLWHRVESGDQCDSVASKVGNGVTLADILEWNPGVGSDCSALWLGYYVCVGVSAEIITTTTTTTTTSSTFMTTSSTTTTSLTSSSTTESTASSTTSTGEISTSTTTADSSSTTSTQSLSALAPTSSGSTETTSTVSSTSESSSATATATATSTESVSTTIETTTHSSSTHSPTTVTTTTRASTRTTTSSFDPGRYTATTKSAIYTMSHTAAKTTTKKPCTTTTLKKTTTKAAAKTTTPAYVAAYAKPATTKKTTTKSCTKKVATTTKRSTTTTKTCTKKYRRSAPTSYASYVPSYTSNSTATQNATIPATATPPPYTGDARVLGMSTFSVAAAVAFAVLLQAL